MSQLTLLLSNQSSSRVQSPAHSSTCSPPVTPPVLLLNPKALCFFLPQGSRPEHKMLIGKQIQSSFSAYE